MVTGLEMGGQMTTTTDVDNWPGDVEGLQGPDLMARMHAHTQRFGTESIFDHIHTADLSEPPFRLIGDERRLYLRFAHHRHRGVGEVSRDSLGGTVQGLRRVGLRHL